MIRTVIQQRIRGMKQDLNGKVVIVAGASGELGSRLAAGLHRRGAQLVLAGRDEQRLAAVAQRLPGAITSRFEFTAAGVKAPIDTALERFGRIDGVVNAAGVVAFGSIEKADDAVVDQLVEVNLVGPLRLMRAAVPHLDGGFIVNLTGVVAEQPMAGISIYSAVKAGLSAATRALGRELRRRRILVVDARPGHTETGLAERPVAGSAPAMPAGLDPDWVAERIIQAIESGAREIPSAAFDPAA